MTITRQEAVELCAKHLCEANGFQWNAAHFGETQCGEDPEDMREGYRSDALVVISLLESAGLLHWPEQEK